MDLLRRILGLQPTGEQPVTPQETPETPSDPVVTSPGGAPTAPLDPQLEDLMASEGRTRQLPPLETVLTPSEGARLNYGQFSDVGQIRDNNQDSMLSMTLSMTGNDQDPNFGLFIVADGMGGHEDGEKASAMTTHVIAKYVTKDIFVPMLNGETGGDADRPTIIEVLRNAVQKANDVVAERVPDGGTTATAAAVMGNLAYIAHVGDSRAYIITADGIEQATRDHSLVQRLIELDQLTPEDAIDHPQRNVLYRAIGQSDNLDVDAITRHLPPASYLLICSDGLWNLVTKEELKQIVITHQDNTQSACEALVNLANERGGTDNITVVIIRVPGKK
ncbi:MAG: serine/threonine-protein phosphatase [Anaerolineales bacterium]|nr:serine/threonine-protein phosphatase [Anaerolineales bacterium]